jgi:hypothetical protein
VSCAKQSGQMPWLRSATASGLERSACASTSTSIHASSTLMRSHQAQRTMTSGAAVSFSPAGFSITASRPLTLRRGGSEGKGRAVYLKMLTDRAATSRMLTAETPDSESISIFARRVSGIASVGLKAIELVNET